MRVVFYIVYIIAVFLLSTQCRHAQSVNQQSNSQSRIGDKKIIFTSRDSDPKSLDPQKQFDIASSMFITNLYSTLVEYDYLARPFKLTSSILESLPKTNKAGNVYYFKLKKGVYFSDNPCFKGGRGRELNSEDILYTFKRFADYKVNLLSWFLLENKIVGLDDFRTYTKTKPSLNGRYTQVKVQGIKLIDRYRFSVELLRPDPLFLYTLTAHSISIVPKEAVDFYGARFGSNPVGSGPFVLNHFAKKHTVRLTKHPKYNHYESDSKGNGRNQQSKGLAKRLPLVDEVHIEYIPEAQPKMLKFKQEKIYWVGLDGISRHDILAVNDLGLLQLKEKYRDRFSMYSEPSMVLKYLSINMNDPVTGQNIHLRKALNYGLNVQEKIQLLFNGRGRKLYSLTPHEISGSELDIGKHWYDYSKSQAQWHMKRSGLISEGKSLSIDFLIGGHTVENKRLFEFYRNSYAQIGIKLVPRYLSWSAYLKALSQGDYQLSLSSWTGDYPDPENFYQLFYSKNIGSTNHSGFKNEAYDHYYEIMRVLPNGKEKNSVLQKMMKILQNETPVVIDYCPEISGLVSNKIKNFKRHVFIGYPYKFLRVEG